MHFQLRTGLLALLISSPVWAGPIPSMMRGDASATDNGWVVTPIFTVGQKIDDYALPGGVRCA